MYMMLWRKMYCMNPCSNLYSLLSPSSTDSCNSSCEPLAHCTSDCVRNLLQSFRLCTELDLFVCSAAKCKTFSSWGKFNWGSSFWTCCWDSEIVPCVHGDKRWDTADIVIHWVCLASGKKRVFLYQYWVNQCILSVPRGPGLCCAWWEYPQLQCVPQSFPADCLWYLPKYTSGNVLVSWAGITAL